MRFRDRLGKLLKSLLALFPTIFQVGMQDSLGNKGTLRCSKIRAMEEERLCYAEVSDVVGFDKQYRCLGFFLRRIYYIVSFVLQYYCFSPSVPDGKSVELRRVGEN